MFISIFSPVVTEVAHLETAPIGKYPTSGDEQTIVSPLNKETVKSPVWFASKASNTPWPVAVQLNISSVSKAEQSVRLFIKLGTDTAGPGLTLFGSYL